MPCPANLLGVMHATRFASRALRRHSEEQPLKLHTTPWTIFLYTNRYLRDPTPSRKNIHCMLELRPVAQRVRRAAHHAPSPPEITNTTGDARHPPRYRRVSSLRAKCPVFVFARSPGTRNRRTSLRCLALHLKISTGHCVRMRPSCKKCCKRFSTSRKSISGSPMCALGFPNSLKNSRKLTPVSRPPNRSSTAAKLRSSPP